MVYTTLHFSSAAGMDALGLSSSRPSFLVKAALYGYLLGDVVRDECVRRLHQVDARSGYGT